MKSPRGIGEALLRLHTLLLSAGTNEETARELIRNSGLKLEMIDNLDKAAQAAVASAK
jgi:succinyl-CoA synthetase beta subunit